MAPRAITFIATFPSSFLRFSSAIFLWTSRGANWTPPDDNPWMRQEHGRWWPDPFPRASNRSFAGGPPSPIALRGFASPLSPPCGWRICRSGPVLHHTASICTRQIAGWPSRNRRGTPVGNRFSASDGVPVARAPLLPELESLSNFSMVWIVPKINLFRPGNRKKGHTARGWP